jgi:hypothetical protein
MNGLLTRRDGISWMYLRTWLFSVLVIAAVVVATITAAAASAKDPRLLACGADTRGNKLAAAFELDKARDFWTRFPHALDAPELRRDEPIFVAVFDGKFTTTVVGGHGVESAEFHDVVCVIHPPSEFFPDGETAIYYDVSRTGFTP